MKGESVLYLLDQYNVFARRFCYPNLRATGNRREGPLMNNQLPVSA